MNIYIVYCKNRKKFDKYAKINKIKNKIVIDIKFLLTDSNIDYSQYKELFDLLIYNKLINTINKSKDIYYIPNFDDFHFEVSDLLALNKLFKNGVNVNALIFNKEFDNTLTDDNDILNDVYNQLQIFNTVQILEDY